MKCPECVKAGKKSRVFVGISATTAAYYKPWYDEDGNYHHHDGNHTDTEMRCSEGHTWYHREDKNPCPTCGKWWEKENRDERSE